MKVQNIQRYDLLNTLCLLVGQQFSLCPQATLFPALGVEQLSFSGYEPSPPT